MNELNTSEMKPSRRLFFARLADAVRRQDWFTVIVEIAIVVLGVVIGFQVNDWGQRRADRAKEQAYLRQLAADLRETERAIDDAHSSVRPGERAANRLHQSFYTLERPPRDSVRLWLGRYDFLRRVRPVTGTVEALVATGDLALVRDDSLRSAILDYLESSRSLVEDQREILDGLWRDGARTIRNRIDMPYLLVEFYPDGLFAKLFDEPSETAYFEGPRREPFPIDVEAILTDKLLSAALDAVTTGNANFRRVRMHMLEDAKVLREAVEVEIKP